MARGVNKVILIGNLGADPETRAMPSGSTVANLRIATTENWKDRTSGENQERTEWHRVALFGKLAEIAGEYLRKGSQVYIEGSLRTRKWTDKQGNERFSTEIIGNEMQMLGGNAGGEGGGFAGGQGGGGARPQQARAAGGGGGNYGGGASAGGGGGQQRGGGNYGGGSRGGDDYGQPRGGNAPPQRSAPPANEGFDDDDIPF